MSFNIKTSLTNKNIVVELTRKLFPFGGGAENVIARIAFAHSIAKNKSLNLVNDLKDSKGKEYKADILLGDLRNYYIALVCQKYNIHKSDPNISKFIKMHVDDGLEEINEIFTLNKNLSGLDFIIKEITVGIEANVQY